jgi:two-component system, response regulator RegA
MQRLLLVDDDEVFCSVLAQALRKRGFDVVVAHDIESGLAAAVREPPAYALVDLCLPDASGLRIVERLGALTRDVRIVVLTGYASIATAVEAVKLGAVHYLTKPADIDDIVCAFGRDEGDASAPHAPRPMSVDRLEWEHIQKVLLECDGNISMTARRLGMHRRTLQRKLQKRPVRQ